MLRHLGMMEKAVMIENALLYTLESGVHTGDFGDKSIPSVNTTVFAQTIIDNFGKQPTQNPKPSLPDFNFVPTNSAITKNPMLLSSKNEAHKIVGADFFIETTLQPNELAAVAIKQEKDQLKLVTISNRGTQVWPTGSVFTNLVNQYRIRFETEATTPLTQSDVLDLYTALSKDFRISSVEILSMWGDKKAYSLAQGQ
jgi:isocitrate dehydrogenase